MEILFGLVSAGVLIARLLAAAQKRSAPIALAPAPEPLCPVCANAHIVRRSGEAGLLTSCDRNGARERVLDVIVECSSFRPRLPLEEPKHVCGFVCRECLRT